MIKTVECESKFQTNIQSYVTHPVTGEREESYGVAQWHLPSENKKADGALITKEDALNPYIALDEMARYFSEGKKEKWTCWRTLFGNK